MIKIYNRLNLFKCVIIKVDFTLPFE